MTRPLRLAQKLSVLDTRITHVQLDKYNEKYDNLASSTTNIRDTETNKQKIKQKSQQYRKKVGTRRHRRETEQERLKRIAEERARSPLQLPYPTSLRRRACHETEDDGCGGYKEAHAAGHDGNHKRNHRLRHRGNRSHRACAKVEREVVVTLEKES